MHSAARTERHAGHSISGEMHGIRTGPPNDRWQPFTGDVLLRSAERLDDRQIFVKNGRRVSDVEMQDWLV